MESFSSSLLELAELSSDCLSLAGAEGVASRQYESGGTCEVNKKSRLGGSTSTLGEAGWRARA